MTMNKRKQSYQIQRIQRSAKLRLANQSYQNKMNAEQVFEEGTDEINSEDDTPTKKEEAVGGKHKVLSPNIAGGGSQKTQSSGPKWEGF